ncbi:MAG: hypothetical protein RL095_1143 [Verrucomicrobiota bacterium]|jgi:rhamnose utilization protein RhaD (predicted bifunctional aldolase and dehydrogenase)/NAD(P)-dependent dehydrogenase (short-subunit alcohol dehydrogenase family)
MNSLWSNEAALGFGPDLLAQRVYSSRLLGAEDSLVLHGGGNTSVKATCRNIFGEEVPTLYIKGSGWDLKTISAAGFSAVRLHECQRLAALPELSDAEMVKQLRLALLDPAAPDGSIETLVHACIPAVFVDHTHADAILVLSNSPQGRAALPELFPDFLILPYVMPGFDLAKQVHQAVQSGRLKGKKGFILLSHGIFTFADSAKESYEAMIEAVSRAEAFIAARTSQSSLPVTPPLDLNRLCAVRRQVSLLRRQPVIVRRDESTAALRLSQTPDCARRGPLTPDHTIRTKRLPAVILGENAEAALADYVAEYQCYFDLHAKAEHRRLDPAPRWAVWQDRGLLSFGASRQEASQIIDIAAHTAQSILDAESLGGWSPLSAAELFAIEYWELEQRKLKSSAARPQLQGKIALVTGAAAGIGRLCAEELLRQGACVVGIDISAELEDLKHPSFLGLRCDLGVEAELKAAVERCVTEFGGLDIVICNAGIFIAGDYVEKLENSVWDKTLQINLTANRQLLKYAIPFLKQGLDSAVLFVGSRNVGAPGPGAAAYSVSKAGLTQLARVLSLELAPEGIRVNVVHPDAVFDTKLWTPEKLLSSATRYGLTVDEYKKRNLLKTEITSPDVAGVCVALCGPLFLKTTGAQVPVDGGNDRII